MSQEEPSSSGVQSLDSYMGITNLPDQRSKGGGLASQNHDYSPVPTDVPSAAKGGKGKERNAGAFQIMEVPRGSGVQELPTELPTARDAHPDQDKTSSPGDFERSLLAHTPVAIRTPEA